MEIQFVDDRLNASLATFVISQQLRQLNQVLISLWLDLTLKCKIVLYCKLELSLKQKLIIQEANNYPMMCLSRVDAKIAILRPLYGQQTF